MGRFLVSEPVHLDTDLIQNSVLISVLGTTGVGSSESQTKCFSNCLIIWPTWYFFTSSLIYLSVHNLDKLHLHVSNNREVETALSQ